MIEKETKKDGSGVQNMECMKCEYKKASADRQPTTHPNTLGGQRPRADIYMYFHISTERRSLCCKIEPMMQHVSTPPPVGRDA